ncbi:MAG: alpha-amylase, partial [Gammaproteobacteria bacterium]|nr:alpha-amylase [Gammaproteobacteria bacterium]
DLMRTLGVRTGELHTALAATTGNADFDPEPISRTDIECWVAQVADEANQTFDLLAQSDSREDQDVSALLAAREALMTRIRASATAALDGLKTRYHGDYHLGQVLLAHNDFVIIDFEGEPARTLEERRIKHTPLKDVAGMLRSFNYAAYAALFDATEDQPPDLAQLEPRAQEWERVTAEAFLAGYAEGARDCPAYPRDADHARRLIELFTLEKAFYEVRYELANRPKWLAIPVKGLLTILDPK